MTDLQMIQQKEERLRYYEKLLIQVNDNADETKKTINKKEDAYNRAVSNMNSTLSNIFSCTSQLRNNSSGIDDMNCMDYLVKVVSNDVNSALKQQEAATQEYKTKMRNELQNLYDSLDVLNNKANTYTLTISRLKEEIRLLKQNME